VSVDGNPKFDTETTDASAFWLTGSSATVVETAIASFTGALPYLQESALLVSAIVSLAFF